MPMLIKTIEQYLYETKKDVYYLHLKDQSGRVSFDESNPLNQLIEKEQLNWLKEHNVEFAPTVPQCILQGWMGQYYVNFTNDETISEYSQMFEDENGISIRPKQYQMYHRSYEEFVASNGVEDYEQHIKDLADPNYNP